MSTAAERKKILILADYFLPGFKAGGPIQSIQNLCLLLKDKFEIAIITRDTDLGSATPYQKVNIDDWNYHPLLDCNIFYCSKEHQKYPKLKALILQQKFDYLYLNSVMSPVYTMFALRMFYFNHIKAKIVLAPRGELNPEARKISFYRKRLYLFLLNLSKIPQKIIWQATGNQEKKYFSQVLGGNLDIRLASNIPKQLQKEWAPIEKQEGEVKFIAISRIAKIKNIDFFLKSLKEIRGKVSLDIYGPYEDEDYLKECKELANAAADSIVINFKGQLHNSEVPNTLEQYHFFVSPTKGENFGHSIFEALLAGKPIMISDKTPWRDLPKKDIGWDLGIKDTKEWIEAINQCLEMDQEEYDQQSKSAWAFAKAFREDEKIVEGYTQLFS